MTTPRFTEAELWARILTLWKPGWAFVSLVHRKKYLALEVDHDRQRCRVLCESGNCLWMGFQDLYDVYRELYWVGQLPRSYFCDAANSLRVLGKRTWRAPAAAVYALLPLLDTCIRVSHQGDLSLSRAGLPAA
jgi:hypothetical protein